MTEVTTSPIDTGRVRTTVEETLPLGTFRRFHRLEAGRP
jgi:hypothetical protein